VIDREAAASWDEAIRPSHDAHLTTTILIEWSKTDALCFGLGILIAAMASADAATVHRSGVRHHVVLPAAVASSFAAVPGAAYAMPQPRVRYDDTPGYNDPSKFGGQTPY
jgi:hypothetical protein